MGSVVDTIERLRGFDTATVANALERTGLDDPTQGFGSFELRCQFPDLPPMVGLAVTCTHDSTSSERRPSRLHELIDVVQATAMRGPVVVVCQYVGSERDRGCFLGDMFARLLQRLGGGGGVTDTGVRDLKGIRQRSPGFQVFAGGCVPSHGLPSFVDVGAEVFVGSLNVATGDIIHGDVNGVVRVPTAKAEAVCDEARTVLSTEEEVFALLQEDPLPLEDLKARFFRHGYE